MANQAPLSPEKYIRTRARSLPIYECIVNAGWQQSGIASVFIARKHSNGNITYGSYLIDTWCLGLKDTLSGFNVDIEQWKEIKEELDEQGEGIERIDYNLAHNIIFGGIEFASDYEFKPHKDFSLTRFILEEDDESIPTEEVEFGLNGKAHIVVFNGDYKAQAALNYLKANFEEGEFTYASEGDETFADIDEEDEFEDDDDYLPEGFSDNLDEADNLVLDASDKIRETLLPHKSEIEYLYQKHFGSAPLYFPKAEFNSFLFRFGEDPATDYGIEINNLLDELFEAGDDVSIKDAIQKYPHVPEFLLLLADDYKEIGMDEEAIELIQEGQNKFPDRFSFIVEELDLLSGLNRDKEAIVLGQEYYGKLKEFGDKGLICKNELIEFFITLAGSLSSEKLIEDAQVCLDWLQYLEAEEWMVKLPKTCVLLAKYGKLKNAGLMTLIF